ncbi:MAG TPA: uracil-DNA glycosylase [Bacteroidota bacterium]|nr:uracil-DNA glycosylase [Bacteroidota bacterium]
MNDPYLDLLESARKYLMQQQDLFGDTVMREAASGRKSPGRAAPPADGNAFRYPDEPWTAAASLGDLNGQIRSCLKCGLGPTRTNFVFGVGNPQSPVMFVGEAPGADEDAQGEPFVGRAGQLLNKIIEAVGMKREEVYICNILKCRPPNNRDPLPSEMELCSPYLVKQIELIRPKFIICLGRISAQWLLQTTETLTSLRGRVHNFRGARLIVTYHPAALLRNPNWKRPAWDDMKLFKKLYEESAGV